MGGFTTKQSRATDEEIKHFEAIKRERLREENQRNYGFDYPPVVVVSK